MSQAICQFCGTSTDSTFSPHREETCPKNPRNATQPVQPEPKPLRSDATAGSSTTQATTLTEAEARIKFPSMFTDEAVRRREERKRCVLAAGGARQAVTDERIVSLINRSKVWNGVFDLKNKAVFAARATPAQLNLSTFCNLVARYTASREQMERILGQSYFAKHLSLHADVTAALVEAARRKKRFDTRDRANVIWQWEGYLPLGKLVLLDGDPGLAKSMLSLSFGISTMFSKPFLNGAAPAITGGVLLLSAEDDAKDTIAPRLVAAGAPDGQIPLRFQPPTKADGEPFNLGSADDRVELELMIADLDAKLVIIDPVNAYLGEKVDSHNDQKIRQVLGPLSEIANRTGVTILCLRHVKKSGGEKAIYQGLGSIGYTAAARVNFYVAEHPDHNGTFVFACSKINLGPKPPSLTYRLAMADVAGIKKQVPYVVGVGTCELTADDLAAQDENSGGGKLEDAVEFLKGELEDGPVTKSAIEKRADKQGIKPRTLRRAKDDLKVKAKQEGKKWWWELPEQMELKVEDGSDPF